MLFYFVFPLFVILYVSVSYKKESTGIILMLLLLFFSMFRGDMVGTDTANYMDGLYDVVRVMYSKNSFFEDNSRYEYLYYLLCILVYEYNLPDRFIITAFSILTFVFLYLGSRRNQANVALVGLFYVLTSMYFLSYNIARQFVSISICFYAVSFLNDKNIKQYLFFLWVFVAFLFHKSSAVFLLCYFCKFFNFNRRNIGKIVFVVYFLFVVFPITSLLQQVLPLLNISFAGNVIEEGGTYSTSLIGILYKLISGIILFKVYSYCANNEKTDLKDNLFLLYILMIALMAEGNLYFFRLKFNFMMLLCLYLADAFYRMDNRKKKIYTIYLLLLYFYSVRSVLEYHPYYLSFDSII